MHVVLLNPNRMQPPVAPLAADSLLEALARAGIGCALADLCMAPPGASAPPAIREALGKDRQPDAVLITFRNLDDAYVLSRASFLPPVAACIRDIRGATDAPVILGGSGFSIAPEALLAHLGADYGIAGAAERDLLALLPALASPETLPSVPGLVWREGDRIRRTPPSPPRMDEDLFSARRFVDNPAYFSRGAMAGVETQRGCPSPCRVCVDPVIKGRQVHAKPLQTLVREIRCLLDQGVSVLHLCDSEFNLSRSHALAVCDALVAEGLSRRVRWFTYASPEGLDETLAARMAGAGCAGVNVGADHCRPEILRALGRTHTAEDLTRAARALRTAGIPFMFDLLLGGPGETPRTLAEAVDFFRDLDVPRIGANVGIRVYPHTPLAGQVREAGPLSRNSELAGVVHDNDALIHPVFFLSRHLGADWPRELASRVDGDRRFLIPDPGDRRANYNYNENAVLVEAIRAGHRGAFWDILRRLQEDLPPLATPA